MECHYKAASRFILYLMHSMIMKRFVLVFQEGKGLPRSQGILAWKLGSLGVPTYSQVQRSVPLGTNQKRDP